MEKSRRHRAVRDSRDEAEVKKKQAKIVPETKHPFLIYDVLRIIFKYLSRMDLSNAAMVCRCWLEAANDEKQTRNGPVSFIESYRDLSMKYIELNKHKEQLIKNSRIKPVLGLFFKTEVVDTYDTGCHSNGLPTNCHTITLKTDGIVFNDREIEECGPQFVCTFLPEIPNVKVTTAVVQIDQPRILRCRIKLIGNEFYKELCQALGEPRADDNTSRCLLMFANLRDADISKDVLMLLRDRYAGQNLTVWGGVSEYIYLCNSNHRRDQHINHLYLRCVGIVLTGAMRTWSIVIEMDKTKKEHVEEKLKVLKSKVQLQKYSIGFMFACNERGKSLFGESNVESSAFKRFFPDVPLVGCFGVGEFGSTTVEEGWYHSI